MKGVIRVPQEEEWEELKDSPLLFAKGIVSAEKEHERFLKYMAEWREEEERKAEERRIKRKRIRREQFVRNLFAGVFGVGGVILLMLLALLIRLIF